jgi:iron complex outermembrane receptor protein
VSLLGAVLLALQEPGSTYSAEELRSMSLEELLMVPVVSASGNRQPVARVPAAVTVLRGDDLRRLGVRTVAEALRFVPGMSVARVDGNRWAVSARGFNDPFANRGIFS